jgi:hypothetical protein
MPITIPKAMLSETKLGADTLPAHSERRHDFFSVYILNINESLYLKYPFTRGNKVATLPIWIEPSL